MNDIRIEYFFAKSRVKDFVQLGKGKDKWCEITVAKINNRKSKLYFRTQHEKSNGIF